MGNFNIHKKNTNQISVSITADGHMGLFYNIIIISIVLFCLVFPIGLLFISDLDIGFGFIITLFIFFGTGGYFLKMYLWNKYGREVYLIKKSSIRYYYDFKVFKSVFRGRCGGLELYYAYYDNANVLKKYIGNNTEGNFKCFIVFVVDGESVKSTIPIEYNCLKELSDQLILSEIIKSDG